MRNKLESILLEYKKDKIGIERAINSIEIEYGRLKSKEQWVLDKKEWVANLLNTDLQAYKDLGYIDFYHYLTNKYEEYSLGKIREGLKEAQCNNTGWPIGIMFTKDTLRPRDVNSKEIYSQFPPDSKYKALHNEYDVWRISNDLNYYLARSYAEDSEEYKRRDNFLFFDVAIWRIAEMLLHTTKLYSALKVSENEEIIIEISYKKLNGRVLTSSTPLRHISKNKCFDQEFNWKEELSLKALKDKQFELTSMVASRLFNCFEVGISTEAIKDIYMEFMNSKV